jgi:hypothetical protein
MTDILSRASNGAVPVAARDIKGDSLVWLALVAAIDAQEQEI